jgi:hypothetical protein
MYAYVFVSWMGKFGSGSSLVLEVEIRNRLVTLGRSTLRVTRRTTCAYLYLPRDVKL